jgi:hypothetical protein
MKLNAAAQAAWNQPSTTTPSQTQAQSYQNGTQQLHAPPGVPPPPSSFSQQQPSQQQGQGQAQAQGTPFVGNGNGNGAVATATGNGGGNAIGTDAQGQSTAPTSAVAPVPQTPAQQVLMSAADRWGLLGLLAMIKNADPDQALLSVGTDLGTMGLDMQQQGCVPSVSPYPSPLSRFAGTCIRRSLRLGRIRAQRIQSSRIFIYPVAIMCSRQRRVPERQPRSATRRSSSCSIRHRETHYRKSPHRSCKLPPRFSSRCTKQTPQKCAATTGTGGTTKSCGSG